MIALFPYGRQIWVCISLLCCTAKSAACGLPFGFGVRCIAGGVLCALWGRYGLVGGVHADALLAVTLLLLICEVIS